MTQSNLPVRIGSVALALPKRLITNAFFAERHPEQLQRMNQSALGRLWKPATDERHLFDEVMMPYLSDPFRGVIERHWLSDGEASVDCEEEAARRALQAAQVDIGEVDAIFDAAFFPDQGAIGNAPFLAKRLGYAGPAINMESACSGAVVAIITAAGLVASGAMRRVLVVTSCNYSRVNRPDDTIAWGNGDAAAAMVIERATSPSDGIVGFAIRSTHESCGMVTGEMEIEDGASVMRMRTAPGASSALRDASESMIFDCAGAALANAGVKASDIDVVTANCPTAWYADLIARSLEIDRGRVINVHPRTANVGPVLFPAALDEAVDRALIRPGSLVLAYAIGSVSNAAAFVLRVDDQGIARG